MSSGSELVLRFEALSSTHCVCYHCYYFYYPLMSSAVCLLTRLALSFLTSGVITGEVYSSCAHVFMALLAFSAFSSVSSPLHITFQSLFDYGCSYSSIPFLLFLEFFYLPFLCDLMKNKPCSKMKLCCNVTFIVKVCTEKKSNYGCLLIKSFFLFTG